MRKGFAIILVLATLVLLALLSLTYIKLALIDRNIARNYMDNKRAKLIAQSGIDYAIARIQEINPFDLSWQYQNELNPSFKAGEVTVNGRLVGYSQVAGNTYDQDIFILKIKDSQGLININDGLSNKRVSANLARIINVLAKVIDTSFPDLGFDIIGTETEEKRPQGGYSNTSEIRKKLIDKYPATGEDYYKKIKPFITTHAWQDPNVANPVPLSGAVIGDYPVKYNTGLIDSAGNTVDVYRYGRGYDRYGFLIGDPVAYPKRYDLVFAPSPADPTLQEHGIYGIDELNPQWIEIVSRSPVNINTTSREVLIALLKGLKSFFVSDRRANLPQYNNNYTIGTDIPITLPSRNMFSLACTPYDWLLDIIYAGMGFGDDPTNSEIGFLYTTKGIDTTSTTIADEIISNRNFQTWRQFNTFCDNLVKNGILKDERNIFYEHDLSSGNLVASPVARRQASQALADLLKANFNPNLHLNELNPDANIKTLVDKTDLIVNSTEFCFTPMGYFEIESEGLVLKEDKIIAQSKINTLAKLYDAIRFTNEKQFLEGILLNGLEAGPEPGYYVDVIVGWKKVKGKDVPIIEQRRPAETNEWGGYIALSTLNGPESLTQATFYSHFSKDFTANHHADGDTYKPNIITSNVADKTESGVKGPYTYNLDNRLARSFRKESDVKPSIILGSYAYRTIADLRIDGAYIERHSGLAYGYNGSSTNVFKNPGMLSYWIKPWFYPETAGKPRTFFSLTNSYPRPFWDTFMGGGIVVDESRIFSNFFLPSHWPHSLILSQEDLTSTYAGNVYRSSSILFGYSAVDDDNDGGFGHTTPSLNHLSHIDPLTDNPLPCYTSKTNYLKSGQWIHVASVWKLPETKLEVDSLRNNSSNKNCQVWINGRIIDNSSNILANQLHYYDNLQTTMNYLLGSQQFRIGEKTLLSGWFSPEIRNWTCDSTVDEFYIFSDIPLDADGKPDPTSIINEVYTNRGRYYKPAGEESNFKSGAISLTNLDNSIPGRTSVSIPGDIASAVDIKGQAIKIIGLSWTWYAEDNENYIHNWKDYVLAERDARLKDQPSTRLNPQIKLKAYLTGTDPDLQPAYLEDSYSPVENLELNPADTLNYQVIFTIPGMDAANTVLLYSPIFDDITIYYTSGVKFLNYSYFD